MRYSEIGGRAVVEGIVVQDGNNCAIAVREPGGDIEVRKDIYVSITREHKFLELPFIGDIFSFIDSMVMGMHALTWSCSFSEGDEETEPGRFEAWPDKVSGKKLESILMSMVIAFSFAMAVGIFIVLPLFIARIYKSSIASKTVIAILEGVIRILIFILYTKLVSRMKGIERTFIYHGSEHKCINYIEHGLELTVDNVRTSSKEHKRCGTSLIMIVMIISILFFTVIRVDTVWFKIVNRIILIPVIADISYKFLRFTGRHSSKLANVLSRPGMWMQELTTTEPDDTMIEAVIVAVETVFDWRQHLDEVFPGWRESSSREDCRGAAGHDHTAVAMAGYADTE